MTTRDLIDISNHPDLTDVTRKVEVFGCHNKYRNNVINLEIEVFHFLNGKAQKKLDGIVYLRADNTVKVNNTNGKDVHEVEVDGEIEWQEVESGDTVDEANVEGEYDYLWKVVNIAKAYTQVELEDIYVALREEKINQKLY